MLMAAYFMIVVALPLALGSYVVFSGLPRSRHCPSCADETLRIRSRPHSLLSRLLPAHQLHLRWCMSCGWRGTTRMGQEPAQPLATALRALPRPRRVDLPEPERRPGKPGLGAYPGPAGSPEPASAQEEPGIGPGTANAPPSPPGPCEAADGIEIRRLDIEGADWRVRLHCWAEDEHWVGRLLFIGPAGRTCMEERSSITGRSALEVLSRAFTLPERTLAGRLRQVMR